MNISELGEFGLIKRLTEGKEQKTSELLKGVGDDCAVISQSGDDMVTLTTTDMLMEGIHFDLTYTSMEQLGYKSAMVNLSDVFAMNGQPRQLLVSIAIDKRFAVEDLDNFYKGLHRACDAWGVDIVGGDTTSSLTGFAISITCIGYAKKEDVVYRSGAKPTDLVCVTGNLGAAYMGLQILEREKSVYYQQIAEAKKKGGKVDEIEFEPDFAGREYLLERQLKPEARGDIIQSLREAKIRPTSMMDISDGLSSELHHICEQSQTGCHIYEKKIPIDYQTATSAEEMNLNVTTCALNGGEDYELLFTVPIGDYNSISAIPDVHVIGHITEKQYGIKLIARDGNELDMPAQGWNPLKM